MCPTGSTIPSNKKAGLRSAFEVLDVDHDGKISSDDLRTFYGHKLSSSADEDDAIGSMMTVADSNKDGYVEFDEFEKVLAGDGRRSGGRKNGGGVMEEVFKVMDRDGDGKVGHEDLKTYLHLTGFDASDDDIKAMIRLGGGGGGDYDDVNAGVTYDGLCKILAV